MSAPADGLGGSLTEEMDATPALSDRQGARIERARQYRARMVLTDLANETAPTPVAPPAAVPAPPRRHLPVVESRIPHAPGERVRPVTLSMRRQSKRELERLRVAYPETYDRPKTRAECVGHAGPCGFVSCKFHLYLTVNKRNGNIKINFPGLEVWELPETCALDVADRGGVTLEEAGALSNCTRERIRQIEDLAIERIRDSVDPVTREALADLVTDEPLIPLALGPARHLRVRMVAVESQSAASCAAATKGGRW